ncbi:MAG: helix-turn-helix domain-containing protein, partial [Gammaproteobacteria bacterium]
MSTEVNTNVFNNDIGLLSSNLRQLMQLKNIDAANLSKKTGIALTTINSLKRGTGNPTLATLQILGEFFQVSVGDLIETCLIESQNKQNTASEIPLIEMSSLEDFLSNRKKYKTTIITELDNNDSARFFA